MQAAAKRVLIYRLGSLGDTVVALPALHLVDRAYPQAERRLLTNFPVSGKAAPAADILENTGLVQGYFRYPAGTRNLFTLLALWWRLICWRPQVLIYLGANRGIVSARRDAAFFRLCGVRRQIGVPLIEDMQQNRWIESTQSLEPEASRLVRNISELGPADLDDPEGWSLHLTPQEHTRAAEALRPASSQDIIAVSIGTKCQSKDWGRENWRALLDALAEQYPQHTLALLGSADEREASDYAAEGWHPGTVINLCGRLSPRESAAVLARARIFLGHDSGPMHLAAAVQTPCVAVFSARNKPRVWFPYGKQHRVIYHQVDCWGCNLETCIVEKKRCLTSITVPDVLEQVHALLDSRVLSDRSSDC